MTADVPTPTGPHARHLRGHAVLFYDSDAGLIDQVTDFLADGLCDGGAAVVVSTGAHQDAIDAALAARQVATEGARAQGRYVVLDAAATLAAFTTDGVVNEDSFVTVIGAILSAAARAGRPVRVFGEMVAVLWAEGNVAAAIELESFWNGLARSHDFHLLCGYPQTALDTTSLADAARVCGLHTALQTLEGDELPAPVAAEGDVHTSGVLVPTAPSIRMARNFTAATIGTCVGPAVLENAALIVTELATNAVRHAASAFRIAVAHRGSAVRIAVEDVGAGQPRLGVAGPLDVSGRGLALTARLADHWGWHDVPGGKVVWAELLLPVG